MLPSSPQAYIPPRRFRPADGQTGVVESRAAGSRLMLSLLAAAACSRASMILLSFFCALRCEMPDAGGARLMARMPSGAPATHMGAARIAFRAIWRCLLSGDAAMGVLAARHHWRQEIRVSARLMAIFLATARPWCRATPIAVDLAAAPAAPLPMAAAATMPRDRFATTTPSILSPSFSRHSRSAAPPASDMQSLAHGLLELSISDGALRP